jgi:hypothetical protein
MLLDFFNMSGFYSDSRLTFGLTLGVNNKPIVILPLQGLRSDYHYYTGLQPVLISVGLSGLIH